ncbi:hypothetical protein [Rhodanobacter sp. L36]|uniref:hypothetical protein n=1 Tax=Rhodanobacter sp. L36 TaxID=1747221 RepID=UPI00131C45C0|nr:hypothetical protein [Rhodanobacter sp. L36]
MRTWQGICLAAVLLVLSVGCYAQSTPDQEYQKLIQVDPSIQPLGEHPFGENVNLYDGSFSFNVTDVSLRGNGPSITVGRTAQDFEWINDTPTSSPQLPLGNWDLDIPRIETLVATQLGWQTGVGGATSTVGTTNRCTTFNMPPGIASTSSEGGWVPDEWWYGYNLLVPGEGKQLLMQRTAANSLSPTISGKSFSVVTKNNWMIGCGVTASDGGEGFLAIAPDGTRYTFAHLVYRPWYRIVGAGELTPDVTHLAKSSGASAQSASPMVGAPGGIGILDREDALMYVTQIQDRFGNTLTYNYDPSSGYLSSITASDGREVDVAYVSGSPLIHTITAKATNVASRTWTYTYGSGLTGVQLPDGSAWSYNLPLGPMTFNVSNSNCQLDQLPYFTYPVAGEVAGTITTPSGLTGTFSFGMKLSGRSYSPKSCYGFDNGTAPSALYPEWSIQPAITAEVLSGPGMPAQSWSYSYSPANQSWGTDTCATSDTCVSTVYTDVVDPEGNDTRYTYSNRFDATEGQLNRTDYYSGAAGGTLMRSEVNTYANPVGGPWPAAYGADMLYRDNQTQVTELSPMSQRVITQSGDTYTWQAIGFNAYAQPTDVKRYSSITGQVGGIEETTSYLNDTSYWVLGLPLQVTNLGTGDIESANTYIANDTLLTHSRFGQPLMSYTFNSAGQLASFTDGNSKTTSLGNYKRGIPQTINYPDSTSKTLIVDDLGQVSSITDQASHTTSYSYDAIGRVTGIIYSAGDEVAWAPETFSYNFVTSAERGIAANHWKRTVTTGNANTVTYFDAMLRPVLSDSDIGSTVQASTLTTYDFKGQKVFSAYPSATALTYTPTPTIAGSITTYDALERVTQIQQTSELGTLTTGTKYPPGAEQQVTDPKGNVTTTGYQVFDSPSYDAVIWVDAPGGITQIIARDIYGSPTSITQSGLYGSESDSLSKTMVYDIYHRLCRTTEPESGDTVMAYDGANNIRFSVSGFTVPPGSSPCGKETVPTSSQTTFTYDAMNRLKTIVPPAGTQSTTYGYDSVGRMTSAVTNAASGDNTWSGTYNFRGMLTGESLQVGSQSPWAIGYAHDANGSLSFVHYPDGENVSYVPDALGRPTQAGSYVSGVEYFPNGQVSGFVYGNGIGYAAEQNTRQLLSNFSYGPSSAAQLSEDLVYDQNANITTVTDLVSGGPRSKAFGYDGLNRLTSATASGLWGTQAYTYDALNNLRTLQTNGQTATYAYDTSNKLTGISGALTASYTYDPRGNVATKNGITLLFDQKNQLTQIVGTDSYQYDAAGRRVKKTSAGADTYYFYNQAGQLMYQNGPGPVSTNFIYLGSKIVARNVDNAPTISAPALSNNGSFTVSWSTFAGATGYNLQEQDNGGTWTSILNGSSTASAITGKSNGSYSYEVQACSASACTPWSNIVTTTVLFIPVTPSTLTVPTTSTGTVAVSWSASATASSYTLQHRLGTGAWTSAYSGAATSASVSETTSGSYTYQVEACNAGGCSAFKLSSAVAVTRPPTSAPVLTIPATSSTGSYSVSWGAVASSATYTLQEAVNGGAWATIQGTGATSDAISGKGSGTYGYHVQGCNVAGCGPWSTTASISVLRVPAAPALVSVPSTACYQGPGCGFTVGWSSVSGATSYNVQKTTTSIASNPVTAVYTGTATSVTQLVLAGTYVYSAQACNASGCSGWTNSGTVTVVTCSSEAVKTSGMQPGIPKCGNTATAVRQGGTP